MSLELEIKALTVAVQELTNTLISGAKATLAVAKPVQPVHVPPAQPTVQPGLPADQPKQKLLDYQADVRPKVITLGAIPGGREAVTKLLGQFNVDHAAKIPQENWPMFLSALSKIATELGA